MSGMNSLRSILLGDLQKSIKRRLNLKPVVNDILEENRTPNEAELFVGGHLHVTDEGQMQTRWKNAFVQHGDFVVLETQQPIVNIQFSQIHFMYT
jgi:UDP-2,3-diacylglucosamine pyrophosphatase LpxH